MRIAVLSDIHSNIYALDAIIDDLRKRGADLTLNLGDILYGPIAPRRTYERLMEQDYITIRGNQDRQIYEAAPTEIDSNPTLQFILQDLGTEPVQWMKQLAPSLQITDEVFICHGTPNDDLTYLLEDVSSGHPQLRPNHEILGLLGTIHSKVILCGHTHIPRSVCVSSGQLIVNPGSVGLPAYADSEPQPHSMETFSPHASYALVDRSKEGTWNVEFFNVSYDTDSAARDAVARKREDWGFYLSTGRAS
ncbi:metallophosphatase family protein [Microbulbifer sp. A4B17]|uniref:metallophosphoesterase family protein n=1 Tax=Microbulbifer sp. A4B17 TaxID=359370 RepID=UPI000D52DB9F|nr:metallophosphoesterase family protein [Microbulbifer sp. A4B17]AWF80938.1 metallophosphatase family protein [Microbulbifer sp. A4B17]